MGLIDQWRAVIRDVGEPWAVGLATAAITLTGIWGIALLGWGMGW